MVLACCSTVYLSSVYDGSGCVGCFASGCGACALLCWACLSTGGDCMLWWLLLSCGLSVGFALSVVLMLIAAIMLWVRSNFICA